MSTEYDDITAERLTAYALGELDESECGAVEARLISDPAARREVNAIREAARLLTAELASEPTTGPPAAHRAAVEGRLAPLAHDPVPARAPAITPRRQLLLRGLAVAAAILLA